MDTGQVAMSAKDSLVGIQETKKKLGSGAYGGVVLLNFRGLKCAGKQPHPLLYTWASPEERKVFVQRFQEECEMLSKLHHPNIVQFLGVYYRKTDTTSVTRAACGDTDHDDDEEVHDPGIPILVMEYVPMTVETYAEESEPLPPAPLPPDICYSILHDVALGLRYLHEREPPIVHRDLTAKNVLLTEHLVAKIADLGVARILDVSKKELQKLTKAPGNTSYMPPEALLDSPIYHTPVDIFSFGVLILHIFAREWPHPNQQFIQADSGRSDYVLLRSEEDRRMKYIEKIGLEHPIRSLISQCLAKEASRPSAREVLQSIEEAQANCPDKFLTVIEARRLLSNTKDEVKRLGAELERADAEKQILTAENEQLSSSLQQREVDVTTLQSSQDDLKATLMLKTKEVTEKEFIIGELKHQIVQITSPLMVVDNPLSEQDAALREHQPQPLSEPEKFGEEFLSSCRAALRELKELSSDSSNHIRMEKLVEVQRLADEGVVIIVLGCRNSGKSSLLNALVATTVLPVSMHSETNVEVNVIHSEGIHAGPCKDEVCSNCPRLVTNPGQYTTEVSKHWEVKTIKGVDATFAFLKDVNKESQKEKVSAKLIAHAHIPVIEKLKLPLSKKIHLIDTPGFKEVDEVEGLLNTRLGYTAAAYVYTMSYWSIDDTVHMCAIKLLCERDPTLLAEKRLVVAITQFDETYGSTDDDDSDDEDDSVPSDEALKESISRRITATLDMPFPKDRIVCVSAHWGQIAREYTYNPNDRLKEKVIRTLQYSSITTAGNDAVELATLLEDTSKIQLFEQMLTEMIQTCYDEWSKAVCSTCCQLIDTTLGKLQGQLSGDQQFLSWDGKTIKEKELQLIAVKKQIMAQALGN